MKLCIPISNITMKQTLNKIWSGHYIVATTDKEVTTTPQIRSVYAGHCHKDKVDGLSCKCLPRLTSENELMEVMDSPEMAIAHYTKDMDPERWFNSLVGLEKMIVHTTMAMFETEPDLYDSSKVIDCVKGKECVTMMSLINDDGEKRIHVVNIESEHRGLGYVYYFSWNPILNSWVGQMIYVIIDGKIKQFVFGDNDESSCVKKMAQMMNMMVNYNVSMRQAQAEMDT